MEVLWERGEATVVAVQEALSPDRTLARTTIATLLSRLEDRGLVTHRACGREYVYRALVERKEVRRSMLRAFVQRVFGGDLTATVRYLIGSEAVDLDDLREVRRMLARRERELEKDPEDPGGAGTPGGPQEKGP